MSVVLMAEFKLRYHRSTPDGTLVFGQRGETVLVPGDQWEVPREGTLVKVYFDDVSRQITRIWVEEQGFVFRRIEH